MDLLTDDTAVLNNNDIKESLMSNIQDIKGIIDTISHCEALAILTKFI